MSKVLKIAALLLFVLGGISLFYGVNSYIYHEKQKGEVVVEPYQATLSGEYVCLPHIDTHGPQTTECAYGLKTATDEYYAVDMSLMSQTLPTFAVGEVYTASGMVTPSAYLSSDHWQQYPIVGIFSITSLMEGEGGKEELTACDGDAFVCPDGSSVGRSGPSCTFAACPDVNAVLATTTTYLGGNTTALTVSVSPQRVVSDSRCPTDVTCVWAGTVEVRTILSTPVSHGEHVMQLGEPLTFGDYTVTLIDVTPEKTQTEIPVSSYRFTYSIQKN